MTRKTRPLSQIQQWMHQVITHPGGIENGIRSDRANRHIRLREDQLDHVIEPSQQMSSRDRMAVYGNAYFARLVECLGQEFSALKYALGEDAFNGFAFQYIQSCPSESYTLNELGRQLPEFFRQTRPENVPSPGWPDFMIDLAALQRIYAEVFDSDGPENTPPANWDELKGLNAQQAAGITLKPFASLRMLETSYPVHDYISAVRRDESPEIPASRPTWIIISRLDYVVRRRAVSRSEFTLLRELHRGASLGSAIKATAVQCPDEEQDMFDELENWFFRWGQARWFESIRRVEENG